MLFKIILIIIILCKHTHTLSLLSLVHSLKTRISTWMQALKIMYININFSPFSFSFFYSFSLIIDFILIKHSQNKIRILFFGLTRRPFLYFWFYAFNKNSLKKLFVIYSVHPNIPQHNIWQWGLKVSAQPSRPYISHADEPTATPE